MAGKKGMKHYPRELKLEAIRLFFEEGMTKREIIATLGVNDQRRVQKWLQKYRAEGEAAFLKKSGGRVGRRRKRIRLRTSLAWRWRMSC